ncbi:choice-of-anchor J domain-containing protein [Ornithobacterium rhinotracheale]|uniref:choice-of-anchor J domain-containing protein n=1 Tax=Ornithobacterium rhinotracheale TaxID=28251 RepID=UPI001FF60DD7|nr:choice-of-anchor J domain-containing protein [Ornithobacterium rhinotracheale]MCK0199811.1 choice-of-anchor J domain-containing protein [Ornithobacterium rhinotracheale]UVD88286.1 choice-of-anchor J domain-containing protein [Ornithobacterium rhinotracheale]
MKKFFSLLMIAGTMGLYAQKIVIQEDFSGGLPETWQVDSNHKYRKWKHKNYKDFHYMNMSAFSGKGKPTAKLKTNLYTPIISAEEKGCKLMFSLANAYSNGNPLEVFIVDKNNHLVKSIDSKFYAPLVDNEGRYNNDFKQTPWIELPELNKDYKINFRYNSKGDISSTIQLSEVDVWCAE